MSWLSRLFGGGDGGGASKAPAAETVEYKGFRITPEPVGEEGGYRLAARIEGPEGQSHHLIRADVLRDRDDANEAAILKAQQMIDQMGASLFD